MEDESVSSSSYEFLSCSNSGEPNAVSSDSESQFESDTEDDTWSTSDNSDSDSVDLDETLEGAEIDFEASMPPVGSSTTSLPEHHMPLYSGAEMTVFDSYLLIFQYALRHKLTTKAFSELLLLVRAHLPKGSHIPKSVHSLKKFFLRLFSSVQFNTNHYCSTCQRLLGESEACPNKDCPSFKTARFISIPIGPQIKERLKDSDTWTALQNRFRRSKSADIADIYDGTEYKRHSTFLSNPANISFVMNTDGVAIYHSSKISVWPIWLVINELPRSMRFSRKHMLLAGLWYSRAKPKMRTLLRPLITDLNELYTEGIEVSTPDGVMISRSLLLAVSVDLPARALVLNTKQYNGKYGCCYCEHEGLQNPSAPMVRYWPPQDPASRSRTNQSLIVNAIKAASSDPEERAQAMGVKGPSILSIHPPFDAVKGCAIDSLHCLYLGVALLLLHRWFDKSYKTCSFSIFKQLETCDRRLLGIAVPDVISRVPKTLYDFTHWKGSELQCWLLYFSLPVLNGILPSVYYTHFSLLVVALHLLSSEAISYSQLKLADRFLKRFYDHFLILYGIKSCTMNIHMLSHLGECVQSLGPLWAYSCFPFESRNGDMKTMLHGTRDMSQQLMFSYIMHQLLPTIPRVHPVGCLQSTTNILFGVKHIKKQPFEGVDGAMVGGTTLLLPVPRIAAAIAAHCGVGSSERVVAFYRLQMPKQIFYSRMYKRVKKRNSFTVRYRRHFWGQIVYFVYVHAQPLAVINKCVCLEPFSSAIPPLNNFVYPVKLTEDYDIVHVNDIDEKCIFVNISDTSQYIVKFSTVSLGD